LQGARRDGERAEQRSKNALASAWAALIQRVDKANPLTSPRCGAGVKIISFIEKRQRDVIEKILRRYGLWEGPLRSLAQARAQTSAPTGRLVLRRRSKEPTRLEIAQETAK